MDLAECEFMTLSDVFAANARVLPDKPALLDDGGTIFTAGELDRLLDRIVAGLQRDGAAPGRTVAVCATSTARYGALVLGVMRAGSAVVPLAPSSTPDALRGMLEDCGASLLFVDAEVAAHLAPVAGALSMPRVGLDDSAAGTPWSEWLPPEDARPLPVTIAPDQPCNIIYSSGTTGTPKGIVLSHQLRWVHSRRGAYSPDAVALISTPLYSNTTLVSFLPALALGATVVIMRRFDAREFLRTCERHQVTHAMLVPVQYRRIMALPDFDRFDLSSFRMKYSTSAPFAADVKADVLARWPGGLTEYYGMTEGGGGCTLLAHEHPDKLHTVGQPTLGTDVRLIDDAGREVAPGEPGEIVGHSLAMMLGYHNQPGKTADATWISPDNVRFLRMGDVGRFDEDGFLVLMDRKKDVVISGGFNIYPSDLEAALLAHPGVAEAAVVGVPSERWGETPVGFVVLRPGASMAEEELRAWVNDRVGKTQRLADLRVLDALPRSHIGKVLKRELREGYNALPEAVT